MPCADASSPDSVTTIVVAAPADHLVVLLSIDPVRWAASQNYSPCGAGHVGVETARTPRTLSQKPHGAVTNAPNG
jgi:hypothetical protein